MSETGPTKSPDDLPVLLAQPFLIAPGENVKLALTVVTEDGRPLRITGARSFGYGQAEITVAEEGA